MNILALDPATRCGFAVNTGISGEWDLSIRKDESAGMRLIRLRAKLQEVLNAHDGSLELVVFEYARWARGNRAGALAVQGEIMGVIRLWCEDNDLAYRAYSPSEIKKHATGKGNANKEEVMAAARERFKIKDITDNQADALWLLELAKRDYLV